MSHFIKPVITFPSFPLIFAWIEFDYSQIDTMDELIEFVYDKLDQIETTENRVRKEALISIIYPLFSVITNKSYQSNIPAL